MPTNKELENFKKSVQSLLGQEITGIPTSIFEESVPETESAAPVKCDDATMERYTKLIRNNLKVEPQPANSYIVVVANRGTDDEILKVHCRGGTAISGYVYDNLNDCYCVKGVDYLSLGYVPIAFRLVMEQSNWSVNIPVPENVLRRFMSKRQKNDLKNFKEHYSNCKIYFLQLVD
jgi:hypothetical protein